MIGREGDVGNYDVEGDHEPNNDIRRMAIKTLMMMIKMRISVTMMRNMAMMN